MQNLNANTLRYLKKLLPIIVVLCILATYGITAEEYFNPTKESIGRLKSTLGVTDETHKSK